MPETREKKARVSLSLPETTLRKLRFLAIEQGCDLSTLVEEAFSEFLPRYRVIEVLPDGTDGRVLLE